MTLTQKTVIDYCKENDLVITGWNKFDENTGDLVIVNEIPIIEEWQGACAHVNENESGISRVNCFYTTKNIKRSHPVLYVVINGKRVKVKI